MSFSKVQMCNMALAKAGSTQQIQSLEFADDATVPEEARLCLLYWDLAFGAAARSHDWKCLTKRADISGAITTAPPWGFAYTYSLPADYIGWLRFEDTAAVWKKVGRTVHTDETSVTIEYVARTEDTDLFDDLFVEALVMRLAAHLAPSLGGENAHFRERTLVTWMEQVSVPAARFADTVEQSGKTLDSSTWLDSRL
jgi:hypothetical protein